MTVFRPYCHIKFKTAIGGLFENVGPAVRVRIF